MELEVRLFGGLAGRAGGQRRLTVELPNGATVADLRRRLSEDHPQLAPLLPGVNVAVDLEVARGDQPLTGAREVALLPPVAGGASDHDHRADGGSRVLTGLVDPPLEVERVLDDLVTSPVGAVVSFLGTVRDHAPDLEGVIRLDYSAYPEMAEKVLSDIAAELLADHPELHGLALLHATGELAVGDHTILVAASAAHRDVAFAACREGLERVKDRVPVWKREVTADGEHRWVGLTPPPGDVTN